MTSTAQHAGDVRQATDRPSASVFIADSLDRAADLIAERGLCKEEYEEDGRICSAAAIMLAAQGNTDPELVTVRSLAVLLFFLEYLIDNRFAAMRNDGGRDGVPVFDMPTAERVIREIAHWNDEDERTAEQAAAKLRAAAQHAREAAAAA